VVFVVAVVANTAFLNLNTRGEIRMLRLENEVDPKIVQPKHLKGKKIIFRRGDEILISEVIVIAEQCFVRYFGITMDITQMDGWTKLPVVSYL
jgi:hypothetical protein